MIRLHIRQYNRDRVNKPYTPSGERIEGENAGKAALLLYIIPFGEPGFGLYQTPVFFFFIMALPVVLAAMHASTLNWYLRTFIPSEIRNQNENGNVLIAASILAIVGFVYGLTIPHALKLFDDPISRLTTFRLSQFCLLFAQINIGYLILRRMYVKTEIRTTSGTMVMKIVGTAVISTALLGTALYFMDMLRLYGLSFRSGIGDMPLGAHLCVGLSMIVGVILVGVVTGQLSASLVVMEFQEHIEE